MPSLFFIRADGGLLTPGVLFIQFVDFLRWFQKASREPRDPSGSLRCNVNSTQRCGSLLGCPHSFFRKRQDVCQDHCKKEDDVRHLLARAALFQEKMHTEQNRIRREYIPTNDKPL